MLKFCMDNEFELVFVVRTYVYSPLLMYMYCTNIQHVHVPDFYANFLLQASLSLYVIVTTCNFTFGFDS